MKKCLRRFALRQSRIILPQLMYWSPLFMWIYIRVLCTNNKFHSKTYFAIQVAYRASLWLQELNEWQIAIVTVKHINIRWCHSLDWIYANLSADQYTLWARNKCAWALLNTRNSPRTQTNAVSAFWCSCIYVCMLESCAHLYSEVSPQCNRLVQCVFL